MDYIKIAIEVLKAESKELENAALHNIDESISDVVHLILNTPGKIIVTGVGKSGLVGKKIAATLASTGTSSFFLHPVEAMHGDLGMIGKDDAILAISYSGETEEILKILPPIKRFGVPVIAMTKSTHSTLAKHADLVLSINVESEACPLNIAPTSSTTLTMAMGDAIAICLMRARKFEREDFAVFHPGGSLGKKLYSEQNERCQNYVWQTSCQESSGERPSREPMELIDKLLTEQLSFTGIVRVTGVSEVWLRRYVNEKYPQCPQQVENIRKKAA